MFCISVNYKKTPLLIRQQFSFSKEEQKNILTGLVERGIITGGVIVSTCNRSEIYFTGEQVNVSEVENFLSNEKSIDKESIKKNCLYYHKEKAVRHLFRVTSGLDSMLLGEDEILHQVKEAYLLSVESGCVNSDINIIFQGAFNCAKASKTTTKLSKTPVSIGTLTANIVEQYLNNNEKELESCVLVLGATGKIGSIVAKNLIAKGIHVIGTSRKRCLQDGAFFQNDTGVEWVDFDKRYDHVKKVGAIISATNSPHYTLTKEEFLNSLDTKKTYLMIDLAVPYDIDKELDKEENITLYDIDYFKTLSKENINIKQGELEKAESILNECVEEILKKVYVRNFKEKMSEKKDAEYEEKWFQKMIYYLKNTLSSEQLFEVFDAIYQK